MDEIFAKVKAEEFMAPRMLGRSGLAVCTYLYNEAKLVLIIVFIIVSFDSFGGCGEYPLLVTFAWLDCKNLQ